MEFQEKIKLIREHLKLSQVELGKVLGLDQRSISNYEVGRRKPSFAILVHLSDIVQKNNIPISLL